MQGSQNSGRAIYNVNLHLMGQQVMNTEDLSVGTLDGNGHYINQEKG